MRGGAGAPAPRLSGLIIWFKELEEQVRAEIGLPDGYLDGAAINDRLKLLETYLGVSTASQCLADRIRACRDFAGLP
jgi:hypothetical protein